MATLEERPEMDRLDRQAKLIIGNSLWRAYGGRRPVETEVCESCGGDGRPGGCPLCGEGPAR